MHFRIRSLSSLVLVLALSFAAPQAQTPAPKVTTPKTFFGHDIGADYVLPNYTRFVEYVKKLDAESDRMIVQSIGKTAEGRDQLMAIITAPENFKKLERYKEISRRLSHAEGLTDDTARALAKEGKAVIWIDGGLHANEVLGAQQLIETIYQFASRTDEETRRILKDVIILAAHANPDGMELVSDWYMRKPNEKDRSTGQLPRLYQKYVGHDNNRDFYMMNQPESTNINRILYREWFPQIMYNHHQTGPTGTVMFSPPFRDPFNYVYDPIVGGSMPSGHLRWLLVQFEFDFERVFPATLDAGNLKAKFDVLLFPDGGIPETDNAGGGFGGRPPTAQEIPEEYRAHLGRVSLKQTVPQLKAFAEAGGVLQVAVDNTNPTAFGLEKKVDVFFDNSPVMELAPDAAMRGVKTVAWFDNKAPLRSGWAWGQHYLLGGTAALEAKLGNGKVFLFGPEITFRAQPHGTFKFLFNSIFYGTSTVAGVPATTTTASQQE